VKQIAMKTYKFTFLISVVLLLASCQENANEIKPTIQSISESVYASGVVKSKNQYQVFPNTTGTIDQIYVSEGDSVSVGSVLLSINSDKAKLNTQNAQLSAEFASYNANMNRIKELKINIELAQAKMLNDSILYDRQKALFQQDIGSKIELEQRELAYLNSKINYETSIVRLNETERQISFNARQTQKNLLISKIIDEDYFVKSDIDGRVYALFKEKGEMINPQTPVAVIGSADTFYIQLLVDENDIIKIENGQRVFVSFDSYKGQIFEAIVHKIYPLMNSNSKSFTVEAHFTKHPNILYPNLTCEATILINSKDNVLTIPRSYITEEKFIVNKQNEKIEIKIGLMDLQIAEVISGLDTNSIIIMPK